MNVKVLLAALAGGALMFLRGFAAHMLLPLGEAGLSVLPYQAELLPAVNSHVKEPGMYMFPWPETSPGTPLPKSDDARKKAGEMYKDSPSGLLIYHPPGGEMLTPRQLVTEFITNVVSSLIAACLVSQTLGSLAPFGKRVLFVTAIGLSAGIAVNVPQWNWYGFPSAFTLAAIVEHVIGFALVGVVVAAIIRPAAPAASAASTATA